MKLKPPAPVAEWAGMPTGAGHAGQRCSRCGPRSIRWLRRLLALALVGAAGTAGTAGAMAVGGVSDDAAAPPPQRRGAGAVATAAIAAAPAAVAADAAAMTLSSATIDAVDPAAGRITLRGRPVALHPTALRVVDPAGLRLAGAQSLRAGMAVRFALEQAAADAGTSAAAGARRIVLIYIDRQP